MVRFNPKQIDFLKKVMNNDYRYYVGAGEPGAGKTFVMGYAGVYHSLDRPGSLYHVIARSVDNAQRNIGQVLKEAIEELGGTYTEFRNVQSPRIEAVFNNQKPVTFRFFGGADKDSAGTIQGDNVAGVIIDEVGLVHRDTYIEARKRMRDGENAIMLCNFNKLKKRHWTTKELYYNERPNKLVTDWYTSDNYQLPEDYQSEMEELNNQSRRSDGFYRTENAVYPAEMVTVINQEPDVNTDYSFVSIDYGAAGVTSILYIRHDYIPTRKLDRWIIDDSIYIDAKLDGWKSSQDITDMIIERWPNVDRGVIDHNAIDLKNMLRAEGIAMRLAKKDVEQGIHVTQSMLTNGKLVVNERCEELLDELDEYELNPDNDKPIKKNDHCVDAMRYAAMELRYC